ncbi:FecR domain-containing protein [Pelagicoccus sp. NFK12]|uniref:FecR domain-containing protein n=1 Tax=Pelagicoccus enzymogenes TaxID=2773457 RepID=A0A927IJ81_9BACT|nr:FecR domain-containing protein [Pelagicoccus enzymogenes]MBD5782056.1 FecR domain-containing protein [Pelagicoccus enzymogenes]
MKSNIEKTASQWAIREQEGLSAAEREELSKWLVETPGARRALERMRKTWGRFEMLRNTDLADDLVGDESSVNWYWYSSLAAGLVLAITALAWTFIQTPSHDSLEAEARELLRWESADFAELEDGSTIDLNNGAEIEYQFSEGSRSIWVLRGEAYFTVAPDPERPFVVYAGNSVTQAVGTQFNVKLKERSVEVLVTEGKVRFSFQQTDAVRPEEDEASAVESAYLTEQHCASLLNDPEEDSGFVIRELDPEELRSLIVWKPVTLRFDSTPLAEVLELFNQYNEIQLVLEDGELGDLKVAAKFRSNKLDGFVRLLEATSGIKSRREGDNIYLYAGN